MKTPIIIKELNWTKLILELLVVFLGVTGGFILQNQKEKSNNQDLEIKYLEGFNTDLQENIIGINSFIKKDSNWLESNKYALKQIATDSLTIDSANALIKSMVFFAEFTEQTATYENILNSGNLNLISDYTVKQSIVSYHQDLQDFQFLQDYYKQFIENSFMPFIMTEFDLFKTQLTNPEIQKTIQFKNIIGTYYSLTQQRLKAFQELLEKSNSFERTITEELKDK